MIQQSYQYAKVITRDIFKPSFFIIGIFISFSSLVVGLMFFGMFYGFQISSLITGCVLTSILEWKDRKCLDTCYFTKVRHGRKRREKVFFIFIEESIGWLYYLFLMVIMGVMFMVLTNLTNVSGSILFPDDEAILISFKRFDIVGFMYIFSLEYLFISAMCAIVSKRVKNPKNYYLIMIIIVFFLLLFSCVINAPFRGPIVNDEDGTFYMGLREGKNYLGSFQGTPLQWLVLINPQTHINYLIGAEIYRMQYWIHPEIGNAFKVPDQYLLNFFMYDKTQEFAFTLYYPLGAAIFFKLIEIRGIY